MRARFWMLPGLAAVLLAGCDRAVPPADTSCSAPAAQAAMTGLLTRAISRREAAERSADRGYSAAEFRAALGQVSISLNDIRTDRQDPGSTRKFCTATLKLVMPPRMVEDADHARAALQLGSVGGFAEDAGLNADANAFTADISYSVQPTDDGSKVFAETSGQLAAVGFVKEVVLASLLRRQVDAQRVAAEGAATEAALARAEAEARAIARARADLAADEARLGEAWRGLSGYGQDQLRADQRGWRARRDADCVVSGSTLAQLVCQADATRERTAYLLGEAANPEE